jgi:Fe-S cluster assembly protein SufD
MTTHEEPLLIPPGAKWIIREKNGTPLGHSEVILGEGASLLYVRTEDRGVGDNRLRVTLSAQSTLHVFLGLRGQKSSFELQCDLMGPGASCHQNGFFAAIDGGATVSIKTTVNHRAQDTQSYQNYRGLVGGLGARGSFSGCIAVKPEGWGSKARQINQNLLLNPTPGYGDIQSIPELEIENDDIVCSHGSSTGSFAPDELFYLRSRGIPEAQAKAFLSWAFIAERIGTLSDSHIRDEVTAWARGILHDGP